MVRQRSFILVTVEVLVVTVVCTACYTFQCYESSLVCLGRYMMMCVLAKYSSILCVVLELWHIHESVGYKYIEYNNGDCCAAVNNYLPYAIFR